MRKNIVAGNWKMNNNLKEAEKLLVEINDLTKKQNSKTEIIVAPPYPFLSLAKNLLSSKISVASQDVSANEFGAYTGEVSADMLQSIGVTYSIIGHSERRQYHHEEESLLKQKIALVLKKGLTPIYCIGETLEQRKSNQHFSVVEKQIKDALFNFSASELEKIIIAYEPVWAIGTGENASPQQAQEIHEFIRKILAEKYETIWADEISILYGGSVKPSNAKEIFSQPDVDGALVGGACLVAQDFYSIITAFES